MKIHRILGIVMAMGGAALVIQCVPIAVWYIALAGLVIALIGAVVLNGR